MLSCSNYIEFKECPEAQVLACAVLETCSGHKVVGVNMMLQRHIVILLRFDLESIHNSIYDNELIAGHFGQVGLNRDDGRWR